MKVKDVKHMLADFDDEADIAIYDDDNDRILDIAAIDTDDADDSPNPRVFIFAN